MTAQPGGCTQAIGLDAGPRSHKKKSPYSSYLLNSLS